MTIELSPGGVGFVRTTASKSIGGEAGSVEHLQRPGWIGASDVVPATLARRRRKKV